MSPSDHYISDNESEDQMEDVAYQYGDIEKIIGFDSVTEIQKWTQAWRSTPLPKT